MLVSWQFYFPRRDQRSVPLRGRRGNDSFTPCTNLFSTGGGELKPTLITVARWTLAAPLLKITPTRLPPQQALTDPVKPDEHMVIAELA